MARSPFFPIQLDRATMPLVMPRFSATPLADKTQPSAISRSTAILRAAATPPTVPARSIPTLRAAPIQRLVGTHSLVTLRPAKTQASAPSLSKATQLAGLQVEAEKQRSVRTQPSAARRFSPTLPAAPTPRWAFKHSTQLVTRTKVRL